MRGTIKNKDEIERLFREGRRSSSSAMVILASASTEGDRGRCAFIAGKKLGDAPLRSRCKRVMREIARELGSPWDFQDVIFVARRKIAFMNHEQAVEQARRQLQELGVIRNVVS